MINNNPVLAFFVAFSMSGVAATAMVTQETHASLINGGCEEGWHPTGEVVNGLHTCVPDKGTCPPDCPNLPRQDFPGEK
jgi:hypothetical protein